MTKDVAIDFLKSQRRKLKRELKWALNEMVNLGVTNGQQERHDQAKKILRESKG